MNIYMFHYVTENFNYYHFDKTQFEKVVKYLSENKNIISLKKLKELSESKQVLDDNYVILTFDDGTIDHYNYVYPILKKYNVPGVFFICSNIFENKVLDIHFIHKMLSITSAENIYSDINKYLLEQNIHIDEDSIIKNKEYSWKEKYIKQLLQTVLPKEHRTMLIQKLSEKYSISIKSDDYYISLKNMLEMKNNGMEFGCHTDSHQRLEFLSMKEQRDEIEKNKMLLYSNNILSNNDVLSIAYPFGSYNANTIKVLNNLNFDFAFTTKESNVTNINKYEIPRYDCNILKENV